MLATYFDESADERQEKIFAVGGFVGRQESWASIEWRWKQLLDDYGLEYYRAVEAEHARKQFDKPPFRSSPNALTFEQNELLREARRKFLTLANNGRLAGLVIGIDMSEFRAIANTPLCQHL